jgi:hypothetical protein
MARLNLGATMEAIAQAVKAAGVTDRVYGWPNDSAPVPCFIVGYPEADDIEFDATYGGPHRTDKALFPAWFVAGRAVERVTRDLLSDVLTGATGIKDAIDGDLNGAVQTARVTTAEIEAVRLGGVDLLAIRFEIEIYA